MIRPVLCTEKLDGSRPLRAALGLAPDFIIEDLRRSASAIVQQLRSLLASTIDGIRVRIHPDPRRPGFFDLLTSSRTYLVHVTPSGRKLLLIAVWPDPLARRQALRQTA